MLIASVSRHVSISLEFNVPSLGQSTRLIAATVPQPYVAASVLTQEHRCLVDQALKDVECGGHTGSGLPSAFFQV